MSKHTFKFEIGDPVILPNGRQATIVDRWFDKIENRYMINGRQGLWVFREVSLKLNEKRVAKK